MLINEGFDDISCWLRAAGGGFVDRIAYGFAGATSTVVSPVPDSGWTQ